MLKDSDLLYLDAAVELAARGLNSTTPNPRVGCVIVREGEVLGRGWHVRHGEGHAEINAMRDAGNDVIGATVYVSLEPCAFYGKTPPCSQALVKARVARVVVGMSDPHPQVAGQGVAELKNAGITVDVVDLESARALNAGYVSRLQRGRPFVRVKVAVSMDGRTAMANGESQWITGPAARADVQAWRARSCAIITGSGTVLADDPQLSVRESRLGVDGRIRQPLRVVLDSRLAVPPSARVLTGEGAALLAHSHAAPAEALAAVRDIPGVETLACGAERVELERLLTHLAERNCNEVLVEAGPRLVGSFLRLRLFDELLIYQAARFLGSDGRPLADLPLARMADALGATIRDCTVLGEDLRISLVPEGGAEEQRAE